MQLKLSLGQINVQLGAIEANFDKVVELTKHAAAAGSKLIVFPELWSTAYSLEDWRKHACVMHEGIFDRVKTLAREQNIAIAGSLLERVDDCAYNTMTLHGADGNLLGLYRKVHLVPMLDEPRWLAAGSSLSRVQCPWGTTGLGICYDLRFPEMWRSYALTGAKIVIISAEWPARRQQHWRTLLQARAIENQMFVVACNRIGESKGELFAGNSMIISPWGEPLVEGSNDKEQLLTAEIEFDMVDEIRSNIPVFRDRRPDVY